MQYVNIEKYEPHSIATVADSRVIVPKILRVLEAHGHVVSKSKELVVQECQQDSNGQPGSSMFTVSGDYLTESMELMRSGDNNSP